MDHSKDGPQDLRHLTNRKQIAFRTDTVGRAAIRQMWERSSTNKEVVVKGLKSIPCNPEPTNSPIRAHWVQQVTYSCFQMQSPQHGLEPRGIWRPQASCLLQ